jgi:hypothetical protein
LEISKNYAFAIALSNIVARYTRVWLRPNSANELKERGYMSPKVRLGKWELNLPQSQIARIVIGLLLILAGFLGFLPVLGFWMIPLGLLVLSVDLPFVRRWRRQLTVWWHRRKEDKELNRKSGE